MRILTRHLRRRCDEGGEDEHQQHVSEHLVEVGQVAKATSVRDGTRKSCWKNVKGKNR
jgi:hypothetical protein